jgi:hypothetical protein
MPDPRLLTVEEVAKIQEYECGADCHNCPGAHVPCIECGNIRKLLQDHAARVEREGRWREVGREAAKFLWRMREQPIGTMGNYIKVVPAEQDIADMEGKLAKLLAEGAGE